MNGKKVIYRLHICKVMEFNPTIVLKEKRDEFESLFLSTWYVNIPN